MTWDEPALRRAEWEPQRARASTRPEQTAEKIVELAAGLPAGARLGTKNDLRAQCGVSVSTFNEALRMVQSRGIVRVKPGPGGGLFVSRQSPMVRLGNSMLTLDQDAATVADAVQIRDALDPLLVQGALRHARPTDISLMRAEVRKMKHAADTGDATTFLRANWALHARIADVSPSPILRSIYVALLELIESHLLSVVPTDEQPLPEYIQSRYALHAALVDAIADRDPRALDLIAEHNTTTRLAPATAEGPST